MNLNAFLKLVQKFSKEDSQAHDEDSAPHLSELNFLKRTTDLQLFHIQVFPCSGFQIDADEEWLPLIKSRKWLSQSEGRFRSSI